MPVISGTISNCRYVDNVGSVQSTTSTAAITDDTTPGVNIGALPAGSSGAVLYVDGAAVAATYDPATGALTPNTALAPGLHALTYTLTDAAGNQSGQSPAFNLTVDTTAPATPATAPASYDDNVGAVQSTTTPTTMASSTRKTRSLASSWCGKTPTKTA